MNGARTRAYGAHAVLVELDIPVALERAPFVLAVARVLRAKFSECDVASGGDSILLDGATLSEEVERRVERALEEVRSGAERDPAELTRAASERRHVVPVVYDGPDRDEMAERLGLTSHELVRLHVEREMRVELLGFLPGFAYLGSLDPRLVLPRRASPRPRVPAGTLGLAGNFSGIYPFDSPGGWNWLGRAPTLRLFDGDRDEPCLFAPGDRVRFESIDAADVPKEGPLVRAVAEPASVARALVIERSPPGVTVQDAGRRGQLGRGLPLSGALDPERRVAANRAVGNPDDAAVLDIPLGALTLRARGDVVVSLDGAPALHLRDGAIVETSEAGRAHVVAVRGGIDVPSLLGSRSTLLVARWGGFLGCSLRRGDVVPIGLEGDDLREPESGVVDTAEDLELEVDVGPHGDRFPRGAFERLLEGEFSVSPWSDRTGQRLDGTKIPREGIDSALPVPMIRGAIQIATDGVPLVLGPDHPVTGGYPVLAVLRPSSWGRLARKAPGARVRFRA